MNWAAHPVVCGLLADAALVAGVEHTGRAMAAVPSVLEETLAAFNQRYHWTAVCPRCRRTEHFRGMAIGGNLRRHCQRCPWMPVLRSMRLWWMETPRWRQRIVLEMIVAMEIDALEREPTAFAEHITARRRWSPTIS